MEIGITKGSDRDWLRVVHIDGRVEESTFPKKGFIPHDAVHLFAERALRMRRGFWGHVADGHGIESIQPLAKNAGHASAKRSDVPHPSIMELLQAERLVECLEAALWSGTFDYALFRANLQAGCELSHVPLPSVDEPTLADLHSQILQFAADWQALAVGQSVILDWQENNMPDLS